MQTRHGLLALFHRLLRYGAVLCTAFVMAISSSACSAPRLSGRAESEHLQQSPCEQAYELATLNDFRAKAGQPVVARYLSATEAQRQWLLVAANCPQRFTQGTLRSAQNAMLRDNLSTTLDQPTHEDDPGTSPLGQSTITAIDSTVLTSLALAEDRAGFAIEVMASRDIPGTTIATSDAYKASAALLMSDAISLDRNITDPRRKVYAVDAILTHPHTMDDPVTGLEAPTPAIVEMNCAREQVAAVTQGAANDATHLDDLHDANGRAREQDLLLLAVLVSGHARAAFNLGYPTFDHALFS